MQDILIQIQDFLLHNSDQWWVYPIAGLFCFIDGFFPPVPSESIVISFATLVRTGSTNLVLLILFCYAGAFLGDNVAYWIGRIIPLHKIFRGEKGAEKLDKVRKLIDGRTAQVLLSARFIPIYRIIINMMAGFLRVQYRRFVIIDLVSTFVWVVFSVCIGLFAGSLFHQSPLLGIGIGIIIGIALGFVLERVVAVINKRRGIDTKSELMSDDDPHYTFHTRSHKS